MGKRAICDVVYDILNPIANRLNRNERLANVITQFSIYENYKLIRKKKGSFDGYFIFILKNMRKK